VAAIISALVHDRQFEDAIQKKIGTAVNTDDLEKELDTVKGQLRQLLSTKSRLENQMDTLDVSDPHYERKILDLQRRYDDQYDKIAEAELHIEDIRSEQISGENVYQLLLAFDELYGEMDEPGKKELLRAIIERIDLFPEKREDGCWIRNIVFTFPVPIQGHEVKELPLEKSTLLETVCLLSKKMRSRRTVLRLALMLRIITGSGVQRKTFDRLLNFEEYMKTCGMNRDTGLPQVFLLLKLYCSDIINMTYRCRVTCVSIYTERERT